MKNALLVVDVQEAFVNKNVKDIPRKIKEFVQYHNFDFVLFFKFLNTPDSNWVKILNWKKMMKLNDAKVSPELVPFLKKDNAFIKNSFSVFGADKFKDFLKKHKVSKLFICGLDTDACVYASATEAFSRGFEVRVIEDLCGASHGKEYHKMGLKIIRANLGEKTLIKSGNLKL